MNARHDCWQLMGGLLLGLLAGWSGLSPSLLAATGEHGAIQIDAAFPGGNIVYERSEGDTVFVHQDLRDTAGDWFYWQFRVRGAAGRTLKFQFTKSNVIGVRGPAVSRDAGRTWTWLGTNTLQGASFRYTFPPEAHDTRFAFAIPYLESNLRDFLGRCPGNDVLKIETLCHSAKGRSVELLRVGRIQGEPKARVLLTARHHACESLASYTLEGLLEAVLRGQGDGAWLREHVEFMAIPFIDKDGVEDGDQGKNRQPHDHNRDYQQKLYASVQALTELVPAWSQGKLRVALDLHCPWIRGPHNEVIYFVGGPDLKNWARVTTLAELLEKVQQGPLRFRVRDNLPFGQAWNTAANENGLKSFGRWAAELPGMSVASSMEIPYANAAGKEVNAESARALGSDLAKALKCYLDRPE